MKKIKIEEVDNGYIVSVDGFIRASGTKVYKNTEEFKLLEDLGYWLVDHYVKVEER